MPKDRFFADDPLLVDTLVTLDKKERHHLRVMRIEQNGSVEVINGQGILAHAKRIEDSLLIESREEGHPLPKITLCQAIPKGNRLDSIIEKGTEIGMERLCLFPGERSEKRSLSDHALQRAREISKAAIKQSGRLFLPKIELMPPLKDWEKPEGFTLFGTTKEGKRLPKLSLPLLFFIGPEAGFSPQEEQLLEEWGQGICLSDAILRSDTAPLVALSLLNYSLLETEKI